MSAFVSEAFTSSAGETSIVVPAAVVYRKCMSTLNGRQTQKLSEGLRETFTPDALDEFLYIMLDRRREDITLDNSYAARVFRLIRVADSEGWVFWLINAAQEARPGNALIQSLAGELGLGTAPASFERIILESMPFVDVSKWRAQLGELEAQVCRVEIPVGTQTTVGTGFLVGADLCLTNFHVVKALIDKVADPRQAMLRFDYKRTADGAVVNEGTLFRLADNWLVTGRPPSMADELPDSAGKMPDKGELDFALLRIQGTPGKQAVGSAGNLTAAPKRGWIRRVGTEGFKANYPILILQHPQGAPLKLALGRSNGLNANGTRLRHQVNTERGSSGSPCLNADLELIALHRGGDPNFDSAHKPTCNSAVPIAAICNYLAQSDFIEELFSS